MNSYGQGLPPAFRFGTTRWSVVLRAAAAPTEEARDALNDLAQSYWYPLYAFARRRGNSHHDAMDLTQGFFAQLLHGQTLGSVAPKAGRFRSFLIASFKNFMANQYRASHTLRRGGAVEILPLDGHRFESRYEHEPAENETPDRLYERFWVEALLDRVRHRLAQDYERAGKSELFQLREPHLAFCGDAVPRSEIGSKLKLSPAAVTMSLYRMRRRYSELLREEVAATLDDPAEVDDELRELMNVVSRK